MKKTVTGTVIFALLTLLLPAALLCLPLPAEEKTPLHKNAETTAELQVPVLDRAAGQVNSLPLREYLIGAVASEMPAGYQPEALKAQAIAVHSYILACRDLQAASPDPSLCGAWLSADPGRLEGYLTQTGMQAVWKDDFAQNYAYVAAQVDAVLDRVLYYEGAPALATYYAISNGKGEASENVWTAPLPYLTAVDLPWDRQAAGFEETVTFSLQQMADALGMHFYALDLSGPAAEWFGAQEKSPSGYVLRQACGGQLLKGGDLRTALGLRSADFTISYTEEEGFRITTRGYGHGVGLSQHAANVMALEGMDHRQILAHCYPGTVLGRADD